MKRALEIIVGFFLIWSGINKIIDTESYVFTIVESGIVNWKTAPFLVSILTVLEGTVGLLLVSRMANNKLFAILLFTLCSFYLVDLWYEPSIKLYPNTMLLSLPYRWLIFIALCLILLLGVIQASHKKRQSRFKKGIRLLLISIYLCIVATPLFIFNPIFIDDFELKDSTNVPKNLDWKNTYSACEEMGINTSGEVLFCFFSTSCYYCNRSAKMFGISDRSGSTHRKVILVFPGNKEDTENFIERNKCNFPYIRVGKEDFLSIAGYEYPAFFLVKDKKASNFWTGNTLNYFELDELFQ